MTEPTDLIRFAEIRSRLTPTRLPDFWALGPGDAVLRMQVSLRLDEMASRMGRSVAAVHAVTLKLLPWVGANQKTRAAIVSLESVPSSALDMYAEMLSVLPNKIRARDQDRDQDEEGASDDEDSFFVATSAFRAFVAENVARGRKWYAGFARATTGGKKPRFIHYYRSKDQNNLGALYPEESQGLIAMSKHLEEAESVLVRAVHTALRQRFGAIADETKDLPDETRKNRWNGERERWRLAFVGSKTPQQIRAALADLWSRAGPNAELQQQWEIVLPLLRIEHWEAARDLALVALASYRSAQKDEGGIEKGPEA